MGEGIPYPASGRIELSGWGIFIPASGLILDPPLAASLSLLRSLFASMSSPFTIGAGIPNPPVVVLEGDGIPCPASCLIELPGRGIFMPASARMLDPPITPSRSFRRCLFASISCPFTIGAGIPTPDDGMNPGGRTPGTPVYGLLGWVGTSPGGRSYGPGTRGGCGRGCG